MDEDFRREQAQRIRALTERSCGNPDLRASLLMPRHGEAYEGVTKSF
jgi:hypothetical protein